QVVPTLPWIIGVSLIHITFESAIIFLQAACMFYPTSGAFSFNPLPNASVKFVSKYNNGYCDIYNVTLTSDDKKLQTQSVTTITIVQLNEWHQSVLRPDRPNGLIAAYESMNDLGKLCATVLVTCHDGIRACGVYVALCYLLEKIKSDHICDVCLAVRTVRQSRREFVRPLEQFKFLYECGLEYVRQFETYANFKSPTDARELAEARAGTTKAKNMIRAAEMKARMTIKGVSLRGQIGRKVLRGDLEIQDIVRFTRLRRKFWRDHVDKKTEGNLATDPSRDDTRAGHLLPKRPDNIIKCRINKTNFYEKERKRFTKVNPKGRHYGIDNSICKTHTENLGSIINVSILKDRSFCLVFLRTTIGDSVMVLFEIIAGLAALAFLFVAYRKWSHGYWARRNVPFMQPSIIWGNLDNPLRTKHGLKIDIKNAYDHFRRDGHKHGGIFFTSDPVWIPVDLDLIKNVLQKDFVHFVGHGLASDPERDPLSGNIFNLDGDEWKFVRSKLSPTFTSGKMKMMFGTLLECGIPMIDHVDRLSESGVSVDVKKILASYTTDVIGSCAFGIECNSFKDPNSEFRKYGKKVFEPSFENALKMVVGFAAPFLRHVIQFKFTSRDIENFFMNLVSGIFEYRKANNVARNDFIQLFIEMREKAKETGERSLTLPQITAQAFVFFLGGFETSSSTMTLCLHELAFNQDIQDKLRAEIKETLKKCDGNLTYDSIMEMKYMDQVVNETLRKYPIVPFLMRVCNKDYEVPNSNAIISKGTKVFISTLGIHRDAFHYPNPDKFDPQRFSEENKANIPSYGYIPFGEGPRICIGLRFGLMQTKTGLSMLLNKYKFSPATGDKNLFTTYQENNMQAFLKCGKLDSDERQSQSTSKPPKKIKLLPWVEKYRPKQVTDIVDQADVVTVLNQCIQGADLPNLLLYGPPGTGKTSIILAAGRQLFGDMYKERILELNASDERGIQVIRDKIKSFAQLSASGVRPDGKPCPPFKIIILDEADSMTQAAQAALRRTMEKETKTTRFCLICNYVSRIIEPLTSRCTKFRFKPLNEDLIFERLRFISDEEKLIVEDVILHELVKTSGGDMRRAITCLQSCSRLRGKDTPISKDDIMEIAGIVSEKYIREFLDVCKQNDYGNLKSFINRFTLKAYSGLQMLEQLNEYMIDSDEFTDKQKAIIGEKLGLVIFRLQDGASESLQLMDLGCTLMTSYAA
ncbi:hypothetical protein Trydic_g21737, partial [Trypoxylus dichotomus]